MFITFYTQKKAQQITMEDILKNPMLQITEKTFAARKVTVEAEEKNWKLPTILQNEHYLRPYPVLPEDYKTEEHYRHFQIPKKSNPRKKRNINAPDDELKNIQTVYKNLIENSLRVLPHNAAHAYVKERSVVTKMEKHQENESKWFLQLDLKDFFNSINGKWLEEMLLQIFPLNHLKEEREDLWNSIIKSALLNGVLPQGSVLSPTLTNICMVPIDKYLTDALSNYNKHHFVYTRYADDITISCKEKFDPDEIMRLIQECFNHFNVPFGINNEKTRFGSSAGRNYHVGLILNKDNKISAGHEKNNKFKAMINNFCQVGTEWSKHDIQKMMGIISYYKSFEPEFVEKVLDKYSKKYYVNIMQHAKNLLATV